MYWAHRQRALCTPTCQALPAVDEIDYVGGTSQTPSVALPHSFLGSSHQRMGSRLHRYVPPCCPTWLAIYRVNVHSRPYVVIPPPRPMYRVAAHHVSVGSHRILPKRRASTPGAGTACAYSPHLSASTLNRLSASVMRWVCSHVSLGGRLAVPGAP
eukprot:COSAG02_NODE_8930_length_2395_cov_3.241289_2_plen_156_part_00